MGLCKNILAKLPGHDRLCDSLSVISKRHLHEKPIFFKVRDC